MSYYPPQYPQQPNQPYPSNPYQPPTQPQYPTYPSAYGPQPKPMPPMPPQPPKKPGMSTGAIIAWTAIPTSIVLALCIVLELLSTHVANQTAGIFPTATATIAATPAGSHIITGAVFGGTQDAFTAAYGDPQMTGPTAHYSFTLPDGSQGAACFCGTKTGLDGQQHLDFIHVGPDVAQTWSQSQLTTAAKLFMPTDAIYQRTINDPQVGPILVYKSADLAKTFPASEFTDSVSGATLPPGTFSVACSIPGNTDCSIVTGT